MTTFNKTLIASVASFLASQTEAKGIYNSCLLLSDALLGQETEGAFVTNENDLSGTPEVTDDMQMHSFTICLNDTGYVTGLQLFMSQNPYSDETVPGIELSSIGSMIGDCETLKLTGEIDRIRASAPEDNVENVRFFRGNLARTYGDIVQDYTQWLFTAEAPLVGLYGRQSETGIDQLGFITLDKACQADMPDVTPVEGQDPVVTEPTGLEEDQIVDVDNDTFEQAEGNAEGSEVDGENSENTTVTDTIAPELTDTNLTNLEGAEEANESSGMGAYTWVIIAVGSLIFIAILIITVFALKRGIKAKSDQLDEAAPRVSRRSQFHNADEENNKGVVTPNKA